RARQRVAQKRDHREHKLRLRERRGSRRNTRLEMAVLNILALNCGSSSLKFGAYQGEDGSSRLLAEGEAEEIGNQDYVAALDHALDALAEKGMRNFDAVGHRFVHGGPDLSAHTLLDERVRQQLEAAVDYAPLHMPSA